LTKINQKEKKRTIRDSIEKLIYQNRFVNKIKIAMKIKKSISSTTLIVKMSQEKKYIKTAFNSIVKPVNLK